MPAAFAFLHHVAAFTLVSALAIEFVLIKGELTLKNARTLLMADLVFGVSAAAMLIIGLFRVFVFEKGPVYYFHSAPFIAKLSLFAIIGLLSIFPTRQFLSWQALMKSSSVPQVAPATLRTIRRIIHWELAAVLVLVLCAALMARGIGYFGA